MEGIVALALTDVAAKCLLVFVFFISYLLLCRKCPIDDLPTYNLLDEKDYVNNR